jgi:hypothetical protein
MAYSSCSIGTLLYFSLLPPLHFFPPHLPSTPTSTLRTRFPRRILGLDCSFAPFSCSLVSSFFVVTSTSKFPGILAPISGPLVARCDICHIRPSCTQLCCMRNPIVSILQYSDHPRHYLDLDLSVSKLGIHHRVGLKSTSKSPLTPATHHSPLTTHTNSTRARTLHCPASSCTPQTWRALISPKF